mmetsp:Transcript_26024/g.55944  ORF Transcript_26024/g.55944 Transcript_26024/m.55944 type:complete len:224 (+) Transcript_26024:963-1634(+)
MTHPLTLNTTLQISPMRVKISLNVKSLRRLERLGHGGNFSRVDNLHERLSRFHIPLELKINYGCRDGPGYVVLARKLGMHHFPDIDGSLLGYSLPRGWILRIGRVIKSPALKVLKPLRGVLGVVESVGRQVIHAGADAKCALGWIVGVAQRVSGEVHGATMAALLAQLSASSSSAASSTRVVQMVFVILVIPEERNGAAEIEFGIEVGSEIHFDSMLGEIIEG